MKEIKEAINWLEIRKRAGYVTTLGMAKYYYTALAALKTMEWIKDERGKSYHEVLVKYEEYLRGEK